MKRKNLLFLITIFLVLSFSILGQRHDRVSEAIEKIPDKEFLVYKFPIRENIAPPVVRTAEKALEEADSLGADFILIHMDTYGGMVDAADRLRTMVIQSPIPVIVFIDINAASAGALISIAADRIYMRPGANIGAATVVDQTGEEAPDKYQSYMRSMMRSTAEAKNRDPNIAQAMVDPFIEIEGVIEAGKVLTFTASEAMRWGFCEGIAENTEEVLKHAGMEKFTIIEQRLAFIDRFINFLISPLVSGILIMLILGGLYFEFQTPGVGFPLLVSVTAAILYFAPLYVEGIAQHWEIALFIVGIILIGVEIFALPGFGVAGVLGILMMIVGLALAMVEVDGLDFTGVPAREILTAFLIVIIAFFVSLTTSFYISQKLFSTSRFGELALDTVQETKSGYSSVNPVMTTLTGQTGIATTMLRPSGKIEIDDEIYDATALTGFIDKCDKVKVVKYETSQVFVVKV